MTVTPLPTPAPFFGTVTPSAATASPFPPPATSFPAAASASPAAEGPLFPTAPLRSRVAEPDAPLGSGDGNGSIRDGAVPSPSNAFGRAVSAAFADVSTALDRADAAEHAFLAGRGGLQEMVLERAQADVALSLASTAASHVSQALGTILGMQV